MSALSSAVCVSALTAERHRGVAAPINQVPQLTPQQQKDAAGLDAGLEEMVLKLSAEMAWFFSGLVFGERRVGSITAITVPREKRAHGALLGCSLFPCPTPLNIHLSFLYL